MVSTTTEIPSRKQPSTTKNAVSAASSAWGESSNPPIQAARLRGSPVNPMATERNAAAARMKAIMQEVRVALMSAARSFAQPNPPPTSARTRESSTPSAAASVGEATPV